MIAIEVRRAALPSPDCALLVTVDRVVLVADHRVPDQQVLISLGLARTAFELGGVL